MSPRLLAALAALIAIPGAFALPALADESSIAKSAREALQLRDPFKAPVIVDGNKMSHKDDLEQFALDQLRMIGVVTGGARKRAMVLAPDGRTYFVSELSAIGNRKGVIRRITDNSMEVREKIVNPLGEEESVDTVMRLATDSARINSGN